MPSHKNLNKIEEVKKHLLRYKYINKSTAAQLFNIWHLGDVIMRIRQQWGYESIETIKKSSPNTKYKLNENLD